ncbi:MAG: hypothetical protein SFU86_07890 [Pirellulaceae bacterium]|nr:hypothetical protein [Pirellulaceae bacterium]
MTVIHVTQHVDSDTLHVPELAPLIGKQVEITIREIATSEAPAPNPDRWQALRAAAEEGLVDPELYARYREFDKHQRQTPVQ